MQLALNHLITRSGYTDIFMPIYIALGGYTILCLSSFLLNHLDFFPVGFLLISKITL